MSKQAFLEQNLKAGEIYAGLILSTNGAPDHHVFLLPDTLAGKLNWNDAMEWAKRIGADLPTRNEQPLLFANAKEHFGCYYYWSNTPVADLAMTAWLQYFGDGYQTILLKSTECSARAVRRVYIEEPK